MLNKFAFDKYDVALITDEKERLYYLGFSDRDMDQTLYLALNLSERTIIGMNFLYQVAAYGGEIRADESGDADTAQSQDVAAEN